MRSKPAEDNKSFWDLAGTRIGVVAAALGLVVALIGLPHTIRDAFGGSGSDPSASQLATKRELARAAGPRLEVRYLLLTSDLIRIWLGSKEQAARVAGTLVTAFPTVENDVLSEIETLYRKQRSCNYQGYPNTSVTFLEISNRGRRDATNVVVAADRLTLRRPVRVREAVSGGDDYVAKLRAGAVATTRVQVQIPRALGPGDGVRVPLFISDAPTGHYDRWCALAGVAYLPRSVRFGDPGIATTTTSTVRRMRTPIIVERGAVERG